MNSILRIPDKHGVRVSGADPEGLERVALDAVLRATEGDGRDPRALTGIAADLSPPEAADRMLAARGLA